MPLSNRGCVRGFELAGDVAQGGRVRLHQDRLGYVLCSNLRAPHSAGCTPPQPHSTGCTPPQPHSVSMHSEGRPCQPKEHSGLITIARLLLLRTVSSCRTTVGSAWRLSVRLATCASRRHFMFLYCGSFIDMRSRRSRTAIRLSRYSFSRDELSSSGNPSTTIESWKSSSEIKSLELSVRRYIRPCTPCSTVSPGTPSFSDGGQATDETTPRHAAAAQWAHTQTP